MTGTTSNLFCGPLGFGNGPEQVWLLKADATGGTYDVHVTSTDHAVYGYQVTDCTDSMTATSCAGDGASQDVRFDAVVAANAQAYVVADCPSGTTGTYAITATKVQFHAAGGSCDGVTVRCSGGLTCQSGLCYTLASWCASPRATGTVTADAAPVNGATSGTTSALTCDSGYAGAGPEQFWVFTPTVAGTYNVHVTSPDHELVIYDTSDCTNASLTANCTTGGRDLNFDVALTAGQTAYLVVDAPASAVGAYALQVQTVQFRAQGAACDPTQPLKIRCVAGTYCDATSHCSLTQAEVEPNDSAAQANAAVSGRPITGTKSTATDVDWFSINANAGDLIVAETRDGATYKCGSGATYSLDSRLRVFSATDLVNPIALNDDIDVNSDWCSFVTVRAPAAGTYYVALDYYGGGAATFDYTLRIYVLPAATVAETEPNDTAAAANVLAGTVVVNGGIASASDQDYYRVPVGAGQRLVAQTPYAAAGTCGYQDTVVIVAPDGATVVASVPAGNYCERVQLAMAPAPGNYYVHVAGAIVAAYPLYVMLLPP
jgi:hypothetical protein